MTSMTSISAIDGLIPAAAVDAGTEHLYSQGACHVLATALSRLWGQGAGFLVVRDPWEVVWEDEADPDNAVLAVLHVYALIPTAEGLLAADVFGLRPEASVEREIPLRFAAGQIELEHFPDEEALSRVIEREEGDGAPLAMIDEAQIRRAEAVARNLFPDGLARQDPMVPGP